MDWKPKTCELGNDAGTATRFKNWLLEMGFPCSISSEYLISISRGNYRVVWDSLMKHIEPRNDVRNKRIQVFVSDINHCRSFQDNLHERISAVVTCKELEVWRETQELQQLVSEAENNIASSKLELLSLTTLISDKVTQRETLNKTIKETRRQTFALQATTDQLQTRADRLLEMISITDQLSPITIASITNSNISGSIEKCLSIANEVTLKRLTNGNNHENTTRGNNKLNSTALSNVSTTSESDQREQETSVDTQNKMLHLLEGIGLQDIWGLINKTQDELIQTILNKTDNPINKSHNKNETSQYIIANTSALHCKLSLRTLDMKNRTDSLEKKLFDEMRLAAVDDEAAQELLVLECEETAQRGRVSVLQEQLASLQQRNGEYNLPSYACQDNNIDAMMTNIHALDRELVSKKTEIENLLISMEQVGAKICSAATQLESLSPAHMAVGAGRRNIHDISTQGNYAEFVRHFRPNGPNTSVSLQLSQLKEFYSVSRADYRNLSLNLDCSLDSEQSMNVVPCLLEELKYFIEKFNINENRKLILHNGESLWISELMECNKNTRNSAAHEIAVAAFNVRELNNLNEMLNYPLRLKEPFGWSLPLCVDIRKEVQKNSSQLEYIKKLARDCVTSLQQISTQLDFGAGNLKWWINNQPGFNVHKSKVVFDKPYHYYHSVYVECMKNKGI